MALGLAFALTVTGCATTPESPTQAGDGATPEPTDRGLTSVVFPLPWVVSGAYLPFFLALDKGYYFEEGLQVAIPRGFGSGDTINRIRSGEATLGYADPFVLTTAYIQDPSVDLVSVAQIGHVNPAIFVYVKDRGIESPADLVGRTWGGSPGQFSTLMAPGWLQAVGVDPTQMNAILMEGPALIPALLSGQVDIATSALNSFPAAQANARAADVELDYFLFADDGITSLSWGILAPRSLLEQDPDLVRRFVRASLRGWADAIADPDAAVEAALKYHPEIDADVNRLELLLKLGRIVLTEAVIENGLGWSNDALWEQTIASAVTYGGVEGEPPTVDQLYTTEFLPDPPILPTEIHPDVEELLGG